MSTIIFEGNTYTFGATVSANPGTGTTSYVFGGLSSGWTYGFIIWAFNAVGPSSIVGPISDVTLSSIPQELRDEISAFSWSYQYYPNFNVDTIFSGSTYNLLASSADLSNTAAWSFWTGSGYTRTTGFTAPNISSNTDGLTSAWRLVSPFDASLKQLFQQQYVDPGNTYIFSVYIDLTNSPSAPNMLMMPAWIQTQPILGTGSNINIPVGATGWTRFEFEYYKPIYEARLLSITPVRFPGGGPFTMTIWGPQLEKKL